MTRYTILRSDGPATWAVIDHVDASSSEAAIRKCASVEGTSDSTYVAVPARSFQPVQVAVKQRDPIITITPIT